MAPVQDSTPLGPMVSHLSTLSNYVMRSISKRGSPSSQSLDPGVGVTPPTDVPNKAVFAVFGLIGAGFVLTGIWFFFWAKNGGFYFREGDWEEYKSTVLRRKGPNGTTLSNATASTDLGGGSVVGRRQRKRYKDHDIESSIGTHSEMSEIKAGLHEEKREKPAKSKKSRKSKKTRTKELSSTESSRPTDDASVISGTVDGDIPPDDVVRAYRHEKPAEVGGLNRAPDSRAFDGSTHDSNSELLSNRQATPTNTPTKKVRKDNYTGGTGSPGIRKVESTSGGVSGFWASSSKRHSEKKRSDQEREDRIKSESKRLQDKGRSAMSSSASGSGRRDFSYTVGDDTETIVSSSTVTADEERRARRESRRNMNKVPGSYADSEVSSDVGTGTKSYHHPIPGLSDYAEERRRTRERERERGGGYRRE